MPTVTTVLGPIESSELGVAHLHEHVLSDFSCYLPSKRSAGIEVRSRSTPIMWKRSPSYPIQTSSSLRGSTNTWQVYFPHQCL